jgi:hypothetical protein
MCPSVILNFAIILIDNLLVTKQITIGFSLKNLIPTIKINAAFRWIVRFKKRLFCP